jgi:uncharacterized protein (TIGR03437 family)
MHLILRMRQTRHSLAFFPALYVCAAVASAQSIPNLVGVWHLTSRTFSATIRIDQQGTAISGTFMFAAGPSVAPFSGSISAFSAVGVNMYADESRGRVHYWGTVSSNGDSISGEYGIRTAEGNWVARRLPGFGPPRITAVANAASGTTGPVAPGEIISIYGHAPTNPIGPSTAASLALDDSGKVTTALAGVRVMFLPSRVYAPLTYVSAGQINAVVPYELAGISAVQVQMQYGSETSDVFGLQVAATAPGIFTSDGSDIGQGAILNHDATPNGAATPEPRGGIATLYVTGEGQTSPAGVYGSNDDLILEPSIDTPAGCDRVRCDEWAACSCTVLRRGTRPNLRRHAS